MKIEEIKHEMRGQVFVERRIVEASFEEWIGFLFNRPSGDTHWCFDEQDLEWKVPQELTAEYLAQTFEAPQMWMAKFSPQQVADGLAHTWNTSMGDLFRLLVDPTVTWQLQKRVIEALIPLYQHCFSKLCHPGLSHLNECGDNPLNGVCYMFWDVCLLSPQPEDRANRDRDNACLRVMEQTLRIDHDACRESALHGLGHWASSYPSRVESIIQQGLKAVRKRLRKELLAYADNAQIGNIV
jgi:hypothetical protein